MKQQTGWLSPSGDFFSCAHYDHISKAEEICNVFLYPVTHTYYDDELLKLGWAKLGISLIGNKQFYVRWERKLTSAQRYELKDMIEEPNPLLPFDSLTLGMWKYEDDCLREE